MHTITADNGREFANQEEIAEALEAEIYFAHPDSWWERGANENANGLLRQYVAKGSDLRQVSEDEMSLAMARINYRPKKCLGFKQPAVIFKEMCMAAWMEKCRTSDLNSGFNMHLSNCKHSQMLNDKF